VYQNEVPGEEEPNDVRRMTGVRSPPKPAVMIHEGIAAVTQGYNYGSLMQTPICKANIMLFGQVIFSRNTLGPHVNQLVIGKPSLADSTIMMQLCRRCWEVENLPHCT